jgi:cell division protein ZapA
MPDITIEIGGRHFEVACQEGEEPYLHAAASLLNEEATALAAQIGRTPEPRMLLMAGLMLADKTAGLQEKLAKAEAELAQLRKAAGTSGPGKTALPEGLTEALTGIAEKAETLADMADEIKAG